MSSMEHHFGLLTEISLNIAGCLDKIQAYNEQNEGAIKFENYGNDEIYIENDNEFFYHADKDALFKITHHIKSETGADGAFRIDTEQNGTPEQYIFSTGFYNGVTDLSEMLEEVVNESLIKPVGVSSSSDADLWRIVAAFNGWNLEDGQIWHRKTEIDRVIKFLQSVREALN